MVWLAIIIVIVAAISIVWNKLMSIPVWIVFGVLGLIVFLFANFCKKEARSNEDMRVAVVSYIISVAFWVGAFLLRHMAIGKLLSIILFLD